MNYQMGGFPALEQFTNLNTSWGNFWKGGNYFKTPPPLGFNDDSTMLNATVNRNQGALDLYNNTQDFNKRTGASEWGNTALNYGYRQEWNSRNPNATDADKARFDNYQNFYNTYEGKSAPEWDGTSTLEGGAPGSTLGDYNAWKTGREGAADYAKKEWSKNNDLYRDWSKDANKQMGQAMTNSAAGVFSGLNYQNAYKEPEPINLQQGFQGVEYAQYGANVGPSLSSYAVSSENPDKTISAFQGPIADKINFEGRGTQLPGEFQTVIANNDILESLVGIQSVGKSALKKLSKNALIDLLKVNSKHITNTAAQQAAQETAQAVKSQQYGGNMNLTGYTPNTPTMNNKINTIPGGNISMSNTPFPVVGIGKNGYTQIMQPGQQYKFGYNDNVNELPLQQFGGRLLHAQTGANVPFVDPGYQGTDAHMAQPRNINNDPNYMGENDLYTYFKKGDKNFVRKHKRTNQEDVFDQQGIERAFQEDNLWTNPATTPGAASTQQTTTVLPNMIGGRMALGQTDYPAPQFGIPGFAEATNPRLPYSPGMNPANTTAPRFNLDPNTGAAYAMDDNLDGYGTPTGLNKQGSGSASNFKNEIMYSKGDKLYEYSKDPAGNWLTRKRNSKGDWINIQKNTEAVTELELQSEAGKINPAKTKSGNTRKTIASSVQSTSPSYNGSNNMQLIYDPTTGQSTLGYPGQTNVTTEAPTINPQSLSWDPMNPTANYTPNPISFNPATPNNATWNPAIQQDTAAKLAGVQNMGSYKQNEINNRYSNTNPNTEYTSPKIKTIQRNKQVVEKNQQKYTSEIASIENDEWMSPQMKTTKINNLKTKLLESEKELQRYDSAYKNEVSRQTSFNQARDTRYASAAKQEQERLQARLQKEQGFKQRDTAATTKIMDEASTKIDDYDNLNVSDSEGFKKIYGNNKILRSSKGEYKLKKDGKLVDKIFKSKKEVLDELQKNHVYKSTSKYQYGGAISKFQFGGEINNDHTFPIHPITEEFMEIQTEYGETIMLPDGTIVNVKASDKHKHMDKDEVTDILPEGAYVFSADPKMKFSVNSKIGTTKVEDMNLGQSVFEYKENEITPGPEKIYVKDVFFGNSKKELTTAEISNNIKKKFELRDQKNDFFVDRAVEENKEQRVEYLSILKAMNEFKKPKSKREVPQAQYGMDISSMLPMQSTNNALDGVMGYSNRAMDPYKRMDNTKLNQFNAPFKQPSLPTIPKMYAEGGNVPHAQLGKLLRYTSPGAYFASEYFAGKAGKKQDKVNQEEMRQWDSLTGEYIDNVNRTGTIDQATNLATYMASLNVPKQAYDNMSQQSALQNEGYNRQRAILNADKYSAQNSLGAGTSMARFAGNNQNLGQYLAASQQGYNGQVSDINSRLAQLEGNNTAARMDLTSQGNNNYHNMLNAFNSQVYNANVTGIGNVGRSVGTANANLGNAKYATGQERLALLRQQRDAVSAAKQKVVGDWEGALGSAGQVAMMAAGVPGGLGGGQQPAAQGQANNENPYGFDGTKGYDMSNYTSNPYNYQAPMMQPIMTQTPLRYDNWSMMQSSPANQQFAPDPRSAHDISLGTRLNSGNLYGGYNFNDYRTW